MNLARALHEPSPAGLAPRQGVMVKGVAIPAPEVTASLARLGDFQRHFETVFLALAEGLPPLCTSVQELAAPFAALQERHGGVGRDIEAEVQGMVRASHGATRAVLSQSEVALEQAHQLASGANALVEQLSRMRVLSFTLRLAGLNASFSIDATKTQAAAFIAVNRALIEVADDAQALARAMGTCAETTGQSAARFSTEHQALADQISQATNELEKRSQAALADCAEVLARLGGELGEVTTRCQEVVAATAAIMTTIQQQDILRQGLDHVLLVLRALLEEYQRLEGQHRPEASASSYLTFQVDVGRLTAELLASLRAQLETLVSSVEKPFVALSDATRVISERAQSHAAFERSLSVPAQEVLQSFSALPSRVDAGAWDRELGILATQLQTLRPMVATLEKVPMQLYIVAVSLKSEVARVDGLGDKARIADELRSVEDEFRESSDAAATILGELVKRLPLVRAAVERQRTACLGLSTPPPGVETAAARVHHIAGDFGEHLSRLEGAGQAVDGRASSLLRDLKAFRQTLSIIDTMQKACEQWQADAEQLRTQLLGLGLAPADAPPLLHALIEKFTLFEHKQIALGEAGPHSQQDGEPGELTLF